MPTPSVVLDLLLHEFSGLAYRCLNDASWTMQYVSAGVQALTGYAADAFVGDGAIAYADIVHAEDRERLHREIDDALDKGTSFVAEYRIVTADGAVKHVREHGNGLRDADGQVIGLQGFVTDVTAAHEMRRELDEMTERFRWIAQATNDYIWDWDLLTDTVWHGPNARNAFALPSDEVTPALACWPQLINPDDKARVLDSIDRAVRSDSRDWSAEYRLRRRDGSYAIVLDRAFILRDANGAAVRMVGGVSDLSEGRRSKQHVEQLNRALRILSQCNERLVQAADEDGLVGDICEVVVETAGYQATLVSLVDRGAGRLRLASGYCPRLRRLSYQDLSAEQYVPDLALAEAAMRGHANVVAGDIARDVPQADARETLLARGHRSAIWLPLVHDGQELGVISVYCSAAFPFDAEEIQLLRTLANNIAFGIVNLRSREERKRIEMAAVRIAAGVSASTGESFFEQFARNMAQAVGADAAVVARFEDGNVAAARTVAAVVDGTAVPNFGYVIAGVPCEKVLNTPACVVVSDVGDCFPDSLAAATGMRDYIGCRLDGMEGRPLGILFVLFRQPVVQTDFVTQTLQIFGARAGAELERQAADARSKAAEDEVAKLAFYDRLTGLPNRHFLEKQLQQFLDAGAASAAEGALLWIDLDHLKSLNDTRGHDMGDVLLRRTSERIQAAIGDGNVAARFGGDEFVVLVTDLRDMPETAVFVAKRLLARLNEPLDLGGYLHSGSASIGLTYFRCGQDAPAEILKRADIAMYEAKAGGRNTLRLFDRQMQRCVDTRAALENDLRRALDSGGLQLAYQPQVADGGHVTGVEALLRWTHPTRGPISPAEFIPIAETAGLIVRCGAWVLEQACIQLKRWEDDPVASPLSIAVNVSAQELLHPGFVGQVMDTLRRTGADPRKLKLELTESSLVTDTEATVAKMKALKATGISFSLDDFGTGFSSLSYLNRLPLDQLKIDRSFVFDIVKDTNAAVITRSVIALGQSLSLDVIAEGVESDAQRRFLSRHGCSTYQGFLFSQPLSLADLEAYLRRTARPARHVLPLAV